MSVESPHKASMTSVCVCSVFSEYVPIGPRFSNSVLQALLVLLKKLPPRVSTRTHALLL